MKKSICILVIVFLNYGKGFASSNDFGNPFEVNSIEQQFELHHHTTYETTLKLVSKKLTINNELCKILSIECLEYTFLMNRQNKECVHTTVSQDLSTETTFQGGSMIYYRLSNFKKHENNINSETIKEFSYTHLNLVDSKIKKLKNVNLDEYFFQPIDPHYYRGIGIRLGI